MDILLNPRNEMKVLLRDESYREFEKSDCQKKLNFLQRVAFVKCSEIAVAV